jgi:fermentation-respiration switch protein FrsA (DUF1100 family)
VPLAALLGVGLTGLLAVAYTAASAAHALVQPRRDWRPPVAPGATAGDDGAAGEPVRFPNRYGHLLAGTFVPPQPGRPVAIVCHGFGSNRRETQQCLPWLLARGYGGLVFDFQAHGESEGRFTTGGLREVDDALAAVRLVQERLGDDVPLVLMGFSMGASVAIMAAARCPAVKAVVADSPFASLDRAVSRCFRFLCRLPPWLFERPVFWFAERLSGGRIRDVAPVAVVGAIAPRPLLLIHGSDDPIVDPAEARRLYHAAGEPKVLWEVPGCGHLQGRLRYPDEYVRRIGEFLDSVFGLPATPAPSPAP